MTGADYLAQVITTHARRMIMEKHEFTFWQGAQMFAALLVLIVVAGILVVANPDVFTSLLPQDNKTTMSQPPMYAPLPANTPIPTQFTHELTKDQFVPDHHQLVCNKQGLACNFGIYDASIEAFYMGMDKTIVSYNESTMTVFAHVDEGSLQVGQTYAECTLTTYSLTVNGETFSGCFEGIFQSRDASGYHFMVGGQIWSLPHTHGAFLSPHSQ